MHGLLHFFFLWRVSLLIVVLPTCGFQRLWSLPLNYDYTQAKLFSCFLLALPRNTVPVEIQKRKLDRDTSSSKLSPCRQPSGPSQVYWKHQCLNACRPELRIQILSLLNSLRTLARSTNALSQ